MIRKKYQNATIMLGVAAVFGGGEHKSLAADASWTSAVSGNWSDATKWSPAVVPNNNTPAGTTYDASLTATGSAYTVTLNSATSLNNLYVGPLATLINPTAGMLTITNTLTLDNSAMYISSLTPLGGTLIRNNATVAFVGTLTAINSPFDMSSISPYFGGIELGASAALSSLTLTNSAGPISVVRTSAGVPTLFTNVTLSADLELQINALISVAGNFTFNNVAIRIGKVGGAGQLAFKPGANLLGKGTIYFDGDPLPRNGTFFSTILGQQSELFTIPSGVAVRTLSGSGQIFGISHFNNQGTISAETPGTIIATGGLALNSAKILASNGAMIQITGGTGPVNDGLIQATSGGTVSIQIANASVTNNGTISANGGIILFNCSAPLQAAGIGGTIEAINGGLLNFSAATQAVVAPIFVSSGSTASFDIPAYAIASITGSGNVYIGIGKSLTSDSIRANLLAIDGGHTFRTGSSFSKINVLTLAHTGTGSSAAYSSLLQLNNNRLVLQTTDSASKAAAILALNEALFAGHNGTNNSWSSTQGITSSTVAADPKLTIGVFDNSALHRTNFAGGTNNVDDNSLLLSPALKGDANLDGIVNFNDMLVVTGNWNRSGLSNGISTIDMAHGDLNSDGIVNFNDMLVVTGNWNNSSSTFNLSAALADASELGAATAPAIPQPAPEPSALALLLPSALLLLRKPSPSHKKYLPNR